MSLPSVLVNLLWCVPGRVGGSEEYLVRQLLGLDNLDVAVTGAAPIPADLLSWFRAIGVPLSEVYGMSENTGLMTWTPERIKPGTVGPACPGTEVRIAEDGEVICRGPHVFQGYLDDPEKTDEALSADGWLHTGDIGELDEDGYLKIVDRKKELIITAGGKNISPANLEAALKMIPLVGQAAAIGDQRPFVSALVVLDPDTAPAWAAQHGLGDLSLAELAEHPDVIAEIEAGLDEVMMPFNNAERVKKVKVLGDEWLPDSDLLTPTSKLKRRGVNAHFSEEIGASTAEQIGSRPCALARGRAFRIWIARSDPDRKVVGVRPPRRANHEHRPEGSNRSPGRAGHRGSRVHRPCRSDPDRAAR